MPACAHPRQTYFDQALPCARCFRGSTAFVRVPFKPLEGDDAPTIRDREGKLRVELPTIIFERSSGRWEPRPCLDPTVDSRLTDMVRAAGLDGAFVAPIRYAGPAPTETEAALDRLLRQAVSARDDWERHARAADQARHDDREALARQYEATIAGLRAQNEQLAGILARGAALAPPPPIVLDVDASGRLLVDRLKAARAERDEAVGLLRKRHAVLSGDWEHEVNVFLGVRRG